jgi:peroxiredoxin
MTDCRKNQKQRESDMATTREHPNGTVEVGSQAPDTQLTDTEGRTVRLSGYWTAQPTVLVFLRHFGCTFCREQVAQLRREYARFREAGVEIVCVAQGDPKTGKAFSIFFDLPFPLLVCGDDLAVYQAYGLERGTLGQLFGLRSWTRGVRATLQGHLIGKLAGDGFQMPGVFIVDRLGTIRYAHRHTDATDNPTPEELLRAVQGLTNA